ncbi:adenylate/guanylate cyclase domain-containing protein [Carboxylicivirga sp. M1479]|uniref:adenylate/guanylate cyclase domain-containing protein n=1 Tax=Carboxylicivirga sp. M1479 TaxID=2594476 RepID=UPI00163D9D1A|nr:adenylate/guanylate cyclase domain-containing protein [Carboxylicivirga sp. M1479]
MSALLAVLFTAIDMASFDKLMRRSPIRIFVFLRFFLYLALGLLIIFFSSNKNLSFEQLKDYRIYFEMMPKIGLPQARFIAWFYLSCILNSLFRASYRKIGISNFLHWITGTLNKPRVEKRIFMFVDMKSSVTIAEKLGHKRFSFLVQDVFSDLAIIENYKGEIYQYLGDGAIISWSFKNGIRNNNCIKAFFAFQKLIQRKSFIYNNIYGEKPEFKAGLHMGEIMVLQVGRFKRDISYNGDTLNTTARIESKCNELKSNLLISGLLYERLKSHDGFTFSEHKDKEALKLKGKKKAIQVYKVGIKQKKKRK